MDFDLIFVAGLIIAAFSIPALVSAFSDRRFPKGALVALIVGGVMVFYPAQQRPGNYTLDTVDDVFVSVVARYLN